MQGGRLRSSAPRAPGFGTQKSIPPMSPPGICGDLSSFSGLSAMTASVVRSSAPIEAAFCSAVRVTLAGSTMPAANMSSTY